MPNIELHGFSANEAEKTRERIRETLCDSPEASEIVLTTIKDEVEDLDCNLMPFLRLISSPESVPDLKERLHALGEDIEVIYLGEWIPKSDTETLVRGMALELGKG